MGLSERPRQAGDLRRAATTLMSRIAEARAIPKGTTSAAATFDVRRDVLVGVASRWGAKSTHALDIDVGSFPEPGALGLTSALGAVYEGLLEVEIAIERGRARVVTSESRQRAGAHFTSPEVAADLARRTLEPLVRKGGDVLALRICDPSMGSGVFLSAAAAFLAEAGRVPQREVIARSLYGIDRDPLAVEAARLALSTIAGDDASSRALADNLVCGNAVVSPEGAPAELASEALDWERAFEEVLRRGRGFDAVLGNPPWVAYAGRAAQPLSRELHAYFRRRFDAFARYRTLQSVFVARAVEALAPGGRLGLVLPTSMADLAGYAPARRAHDTLAEADRNLVDYGADAFDGVFQPAMGLCSTRRERAIEPGDEDWDLARTELDAPTRSILDRLAPLPRLPAAAFGERGFQTYRGDVEKMSRTRDARRATGVRIGRDVTPFRAGPPSLFVDPSDFGARFRSPESWKLVRGYVRQTARFPMAALGDGTPFRNSVLALFDADGIVEEALVSYLNAWPIRFFHFMRFRDARQGMPQVKIGHLRGLPFCADPDLLQELARIGREIGRRNAGIEPERQAELDTLVSRALGLTAPERERVERFSREVR